MSTDQTDHRADPVQAVAEVLRAHADGTDRSADDGCYCGQHDDPRTYEDHAARLIIAALNLPAIEREAKVAGLRDAALSLKIGQLVGARQLDAMADLIERQEAD